MPPRHLDLGVTNFYSKEIGRFNRRDSFCQDERSGFNVVAIESYLNQCGAYSMYHLPRKRGVMDYKNLPLSLILKCFWNERPPFVGLSLDSVLIKRVCRSSRSLLHEVHRYNLINIHSDKHRGDSRRTGRPENNIWPKALPGDLVGYFLGGISYTIPCDALLANPIPLRKILGRL